MAEVISIHLADAKGAPIYEVERAEAVAGAGLRGDRHFAEGADPARHLTLIESEAVELLAAEHGIELAPGESRRQVMTRGVELNPLVGRRFRVGAVECRGIELCEPCAHLESLTHAGIMRGLVHRGGLNAEIIRGGEIAVGDQIAVIED
jgi:MOSC domain-containing protein YiiM